MFVVFRLAEVLVGNSVAPPQSTYVPNKRSEIYLDLQAVSRNSDRAFENRGGLNPNGTCIQGLNPFLLQNSLRWYRLGSFQ